MNEVCTDGRFEIIDRAKRDLLECTNIDTSPDEMKVLDHFLFRCWQMGWLDIYEESKKDRFKVVLPYSSGTFVKITNPLFDRKDSLDCGTIVGYNVFSPTDISVHVSGYKESWYGEYLFSEIELMTENEIEELKKKYEE